MLLQASNLGGNFEKRLFSMVVPRAWILTNCCFLLCLMFVQSCRSVKDECDNGKTGYDDEGGIYTCAGASNSPFENADKKTYVGFICKKEGYSIDLEKIEKERSYSYRYRCVNDLGDLFIPNGKSSGNLYCLEKHRNKWITVESEVGTRPFYWKCSPDERFPDPVDDYFDINGPKYAGVVSTCTSNESPVLAQDRESFSCVLKP